MSRSYRTFLLTRVRPSAVGCVAKLVMALVIAVLSICGIAQVRPAVPEDRSTMFETRPGTPGWPTPEAFDATKRLAASGDAEALRMLIEARNPSLLVTYADAWRRPDELPPGIEILVVRALDDDKMREAALRFIGQQPGCRPRYRSRALFDALQTELLADRRQEAAARITCGIDRDVDRLLADEMYRVGDAAAFELNEYFQRIRPTFAVPGLRRALYEIPPEKDYNQLHSRISRTLLLIGSPEAFGIVGERLAWLAEHKSERGSGGEAGAVLAAIQTTPGARIPYARLSPLWAAFPGNRDVRWHLLEIIRTTRDRTAIPDLIDALDSEYGPNIAALVLDIGDPSDWTALAAALASARDSALAMDPKFAQMRARIVSASTDPGPLLAAQARKRREATFAEANRALLASSRAAAALESTDPRAYAAAQERHLAQMLSVAAEYADLTNMAIGLRREAISQYGHLAAFVRFALDDPRRALELYQHAIAAAKASDALRENTLLLHAAIADTLRFDLQDLGSALAAYRAALRVANARKLPTSDDEAEMDRVTKAWLRAEIVYLEGNATSLDLSECEGFGVVAMYGVHALAIDNPPLRDALHPAPGGLPPVQRRADTAARLQALKLSEVNLAGSFAAWPALQTPERIVTFARRHDPAGFVTSCLLEVGRNIATRPSTADRTREAMRILFGWSDADARLMLATANQFLARAKPAPDMSAPLRDPGSTWATFTAALSDGDIETALRCLTPGLRNQLAPAFAQRSKADLRRLADGYRSFTLANRFGAFQEAVVTDAKGRANIITFVNNGSEWRISAM